MNRFYLYLIGYLITASLSLAQDFSHLDPNHEVPQKLLSKILSYFETHQSQIPNKSYISIIDFSQHNSKERLYIIDMNSGLVEKYLVAHGKNSDPFFTGFATQFSNTIDSKMSSLGFYLSAESYDGARGFSLRLDGLSKTNSNARERGIVMHSADYVTPGEKIGRSFGCPALENRYHQQIINQIKEGTLILADK